MPFAVASLSYSHTFTDIVNVWLAAWNRVSETDPLAFESLNESVRAMAERLAAEGYMVLAVDLFEGETADSPGVARQLMLKAVESPQHASSNIRQAYAFIETAGAPSIASLGWCFGGGWSLNTAMLFPDDLDAAVIYR